MTNIISPLVCRDLSEISHYAQVDNINYRLLKTLTPGAYTFILKATREVPRRLQNPKRKTSEFGFQIMWWPKLSYKSLMSL